MIASECKTQQKMLRSYKKIQWGALHLMIVEQWNSKLSLMAALRWQMLEYDREESCLIPHLPGEGC